MTSGKRFGMIAATPQRFSKHTRVFMQNSHQLNIKIAFTLSI